MLTFVEQPADVGGFIEVVVAVFANLAEGLNTDGQSAFVHGSFSSPSICVASTIWVWG